MTPNLNPLSNLSKQISGTISCLGYQNMVEATVGFRSGRGPLSLRNCGNCRETQNVGRILGWGARIQQALLGTEKANVVFAVSVERRSGSAPHLWKMSAVPR
jgi:hypothetical protein